MSSPATVLTSWALTLHRTLELRGVDAQALFVKAGLDPALLGDANARYPQEGMTRLWRLAVENSADPAIGLQMARHVAPTTFHAVGYRLNASSTLREAFERLVHAVALVSDGLRPAFTRDGDCYQVLLYDGGGGPHLCEEETDAVAYLLVRFCRVMYRRELSPREVLLRRAAPADLTPYEKLFRCKLTFGAEADVLVYERLPFEVTLPGANPELARINDELIVRHLARQAGQDVVARVRAVLLELLPQGEPSQEKVAERLHMSSRSLQRKLVESGSGFRELLAETRRTQALSYLSEPGRSVSEIAYLLGFSEVSTFTRAFRRWTGQPPSRFGAPARARSGS
ncbi:AraC family transcriptional regulator [Myxococcus stipitatus DSM 14675]|uniref:AraC family transcriptional regulator n=1 Tax=Myxococcus stipitatus (strain DSM 14675 / JCM 12634 / Mx s8) TaxID=1278073 RepID=L7UNI2_MYXSD|nr:AraC family transcriptional regulator [Myxococcus stipitatus]AGC49147.1 AraC family transcriptional regulator [Myxococcus stipitatus DSM 14675]